MRQQTPLRFQISIREIFCKSFPLRMIKNVIKVLSCRFHKRLEPFHMLPATGCSETTLFREWSPKVLRVCNLGNTIAITIIFFGKCLKFDEDSIDAAKSWKNVFYFWDSCIWIGNSKLSLSPTGYLSSAVNALTKTPEISNITKRDI